MYDDKAYRFECQEGGCGWRSSRYAFARDAIAAGDKHKREAHGGRSAALPTADRESDRSGSQVDGE